MKKLFYCLLCATLFLPVFTQTAGHLEQLKSAMVLVEGDTFIIGSKEQPFANNEFAHPVTLSSFRLAATETSQALWRAVMGTSPSYFKGDSRPVERISWNDAILFCNKLSEQAGLQAAYEIADDTVTWNRQANGYRLPTEAEWEFAARGGVLGAVGSEALAKAPYSGSLDADEVAWSSENSKKATQKIASKAPNQLGLSDMSGNVWEWCWDWYAEYPRTAVKDPLGPATAPSQKVKVLRGGAWVTPARLSRVTYRYWNSPGFKVNSVGFRVARNAEATEKEAFAQTDFFEALQPPTPQPPRH